MRTLAASIAFNVAHCPTEMKYFGQELFELSEATSGDLADPVYLDARAHSLESAGANGIDAARGATTSTRSSRRATASASTPRRLPAYPNISVPVGLTPEGKPAGIWMEQRFLRERRLLAFASPFLRSGAFVRL